MTMREKENWAPKAYTLIEEVLMETITDADGIWGLAGFVHPGI
jgi:hypothetical protein